eukprot:9251816-Pyramimonas_sp.AAC.1
MRACCGALGGRGQRREALTLPVNFNFRSYADENPRGRGIGRGSTSSSNLHAEMAPGRSAPRPPLQLLRPRPSNIPPATSILNQMNYRVRVQINRAIRYRTKLHQGNMSNSQEFLPPPRPGDRPGTVGPVQLDSTSAAISLRASHPPGPPGATARARLRSGASSAVGQPTGCSTAWLSDCVTDSLTVRPLSVSGSRTPALPLGWSVRLSDCPTVRLSDCPPFECI